ncbi:MULTISPECIES: DNA polymerase III subunit gamma/tau [unclassified Halanaerobium]|uniref:DNA polymerase III subunit gamma/tau n=1 Tax=unclassified Halanaerobium TaxID=2641197 RepID=UPI000DF149D6|nr:MULTISPECIES: DNA polymerase III subunit gamma/tau [unclassified Halanaerobium]RCW50723.1 DNA polymerase-3 subunit gamma/tau [Halanaerobium sp. MA284_MarDTE_T2]RCW86892.1 DNA polymerase-3 subunit gamma/tau [Halanaerobium sp. DL-01]
MSFLSLYRKYRPTKFKDLIGQDHVVKTLKNAIKNDRVAHAYLFAGPRGTGKTSTAKVFARALNCAQPAEDFEPCGECNSCQRIEKGNSLDVIEIDAASNRGIDEIRDLREKVKFYPGEGKYKVYIIDEVHMLTKGAFNALLKTLEEPPESVVFILATTEPHKVITTIMSRCQRFDFSLLSLSDIKKRLKFICQQEEFSVEAETLDILARNARGGMRDGISLLDQAISFTDGKLTADGVAKMLGRVEKKELKKFLDAVSLKHSDQALKLVSKIIAMGLGIERFSEELIEYCRELLLIKECGVESGILEYSKSYLNDLSEEASQLSSRQLTEIIDLFSELNQKLKYSNQPKLQLEIAVIKLCSSDNNDPLMLAERIEELEFQLSHLKNSLAASSSDKTEELKKTKDDVNKPHHINKTVKNVDKKINSADDKDFADKDEVNDGASERNIEEAAPQKQKKNTDLKLDDIKKIWGKVLNNIRKTDISVQALLREGTPVKVNGKTITVAFPEGKKFHYKGALSNSSMINKVVRNVLGQPVEVEFLIYSSASEKNNLKKKISDNTDNNDRKEKKVEKEKKYNEENTFEDLKKLADLFEGEIISVDKNILEKRGGD